jgi:hypothetical protein
VRIRSLDAHGPDIEVLHPGSDVPSRSARPTSQSFLPPAVELFEQVPVVSHEIRVGRRPKVGSFLCSAGEFAMRMSGGGRSPEHALLGSGDVGDLFQQEFDLDRKQFECECEPV